MTQPEARQRLAAAMDERRLELGMRWQDVAAAGGVSLRAINSARTGDHDIRPLTRHGIEKGLGWVPGTIGRILSGQAPPADSAPRGPLPGDADLSEEEALRAILEDERLPKPVREGMVALAEAMRRRSDSERDGRTALPARCLAWHQPQPRCPRLRSAPRAPACPAPGRGVPVLPVGGHRGEGVTVGAHLRLKLSQAAPGVRLLPFGCPLPGAGLPEPERHRAPGLRRRAGQPQVRQVRVELGPGPRHRRPPSGHHGPQDSPEDSFHPVPPPPAGRPPPAEREQRRPR